jgi:hypothetical protein
VSPRVVDGMDIRVADATVEHFEDEFVAFRGCTRKVHRSQSGGTRGEDAIAMCWD